MSEFDMSFVYCNYWRIFNTHNYCACYILPPLM